MANHDSAPFTYQGPHFEMFGAISRRFRNFHHILLSSHISSIKSSSSRLEEGFEFFCPDHFRFEQALKSAGFEPDVRDRVMGFLPSIGSIASRATQGQGYREPGSPSLHCAVSADYCSVHLDNIGFKFGGGYTADAGLHIGDELIWQDKIVRNLGKIGMPSVLVDALHRFHPILPNSQQYKPFSAVGAQFDVLSKRSQDLQRQVRLTIDLTKSCSDISCGAWSKINGLTVESEKQLMVNLQVTGW